MRDGHAVGVLKETMKRKYLLEIRGQRHEWMFKIEGTPEALEDWRADGLTVHELENTIPEWAVNLGLLRPWVFIQDLFYLRNPFRR